MPILPRLYACDRNGCSSTTELVPTRATPHDWDYTFSFRMDVSFRGKYKLDERSGVVCSAECLDAMLTDLQEVRLHNLRGLVNNPPHPEALAVADDDNDPDLLINLP